MFFTLFFRKFLDINHIIESMIKLNTQYAIENGDVTTFSEEKNGGITGTYGDGTITGTIDGHLLKATFHNFGKIVLLIIDLRKSITSKMRSR